MIRPTTVPTESSLYPDLAGAYFFDAFEVTLENGERPVLDLYLETVAGTPPWINRLMRLRNRIVVLFGLKNLGVMGDVSAEKKAGDYKVGDRIGIFSILTLTEQELVLGDTDKHLRAQVSLCKRSGTCATLTATTVVHVHNFLGRVYLFFVVPVHKLIVPAMLRRLARVS